MSQYRHLELVVEEDGIAVLTLSRPEALNALNDETFSDLEACIGELEASAAVKAVIVTGAGEKSFVAGADIKELAEQGVLDGRERSRRGQRIFGRLEALGKPVLAAVNGFALGGGCELALACHLRYASQKARFGLPELKLGIIPGYGGTQRLERIVGRGRALEWILTGEMMDSTEAHRIGLVNGVYGPAELLDRVRAVARTILERGPIAVRFALESVLRGGDTTLEDGLDIEADLFGLISSTSDVREGMAAFLEKRAPQFRGA